MDYEFRRHQLEQEIQQAKNSLQNAPENERRAILTRIRDLSQDLLNTMRAQSLQIQIRNEAMIQFILNHHNNQPEQ